MYKAIIAEDEDMIIKGLTNIIDWEGLGIKLVGSANDGESALNLYKEQRPDIIVTDINMPVLSGLEFLRQVREMDKRPTFIIISGYDNFKYAQQAIPLGVMNYILKPINEEELTETLRKSVQFLEKTDLDAKLSSAVKQTLSQYRDDGNEAKEENAETVRYTPVVRKVLNNLEKDCSQEVTLKELANKYHVNTSYLGQLFQKEVGMHFTDYITALKNNKAKELIQTTSLTINEIAARVGYSDASYFHKKFKEYYGVSPASFRRNLG